MEILHFPEKIQNQKLLEAEKRMKQKFAEAARFNAEGLLHDWEKFAFGVKGTERGLVSMDNLCQQESKSLDLDDTEKKALRSRLIPIFMFTDHDWQSIAIESSSLLRDSKKKPELFSEEEKKFIEDHNGNLPRILNLTWRGIADFLDPEKGTDEESFSPEEIIGYVVSQLKIRELKWRDARRRDPESYPEWFAYDKTELGSKIRIDGPDAAGDLKITGSPGLFFLTHYNIAKNGVALAEDLMSYSLDKKFKETAEVVAKGKSEFLLADREQLRDLSLALKVRESLLGKLKGDPFTINCEIVNDPNSVLVHISDNGLGFDLNTLKEQAKIIAGALSDPQADIKDPSLRATIGSLSGEMKRKFKRWLVSPYSFRGILSILPDLTKLNRLSGSSPVAGTGHSGLGLYACNVLMRKSGGDLIVGESASGGAWFCTIFPKKEGNIGDTKRKLQKGQLLPEMEKAA